MKVIKCAPQINASKTKCYRPETSNDNVKFMITFSSSLSFSVCDVKYYEAEFRQLVFLELITIEAISWMFREPPGRLNVVHCRVMWLTSEICCQHLRTQHNQVWHHLGSLRVIFVNKTHSIVTCFRCFQRLYFINFTFGSIHSLQTTHLHA